MTRRGASAPTSGQTGGACITADSAARYARGELTARELELLEDHIDACPACRQLVSGAAQFGVSQEEGDATFDPEEVVATRATGSRPATLLSEGTPVGRYVVGRVLGSGGMGVVYSAEDPTLRRKVALKVLRAARGDAETLRREAAVMARLAHPNIVGVYDLFSSGETTFVVMEQVAGATLRGWLATPRSTREIVQALVAAGEGLAAAHAQGVVHRDFKPENVLCDSTGRVCVADFGLSRLMEGAEPPGDGAPTRDKTGVAGTPGYMAPEQRAGERVTALSDQFSFCVVLHEALFRALPAAARSPRGGDPQRAPARRRVSARIRRVVARGLSLDPARRYPSMRALLDDLTHDPWARRRRIGMAGAALACAVAIALIEHRRAGALQVPVCGGADAQLAGIWDGPRKATIERAFLSSGKPYAVDAWRGTSAALDAYADRWVAMRADACKAARVEHTQSESMMDLRMACLDDRLRELRALSSVLTTADGKVVARAVLAVDGLTSVSSCGDIHALLTGAKPPVDPVVAARVADVRERLATAQALGSAGKYSETLAVARAVFDEATATGYRPVEAQTYYALARAEYETGDWKGAVENLRHALAAADAAGDDVLRVRAYGQIIPALAMQASFDELPSLREASLATLERLGRNDAAEADLLQQLAIADNAEGTFELARAKLERAIDLKTQLYGETSRPVGIALSVLADAYPASDPRGIEIGERALAIEEDQLGPDHPLIADVELGIGSSLIEQQRAAEGEQHLRRALSLAEQGFGESNPALGYYLDNLGEALSDEGRFDEALELHRRALSLSERTLKPNHPRLFDSLLGIARCLTGLRRPAEAAPMLERALGLPREGGAAETVLAEAKLLLAQALDRVHPGSARALALATEAEAIDAKLAEGPRDRTLLLEARAWIAGRRPP